MDKQHCCGGHMYIITSKMMNCILKTASWEMNFKDLNYVVWYSHWLNRILNLFYCDNYTYELMQLSWNFPSLNGLNIEFLAKYYDAVWHDADKVLSPFAHSFLKHENVCILVILLYVRSTSQRHIFSKTQYKWDKILFQCNTVSR